MYTKANTPSMYSYVRGQKSCYRDKNMLYTAARCVRKVEISGVILLLLVTVYLITLSLTNEWNPG